MIKWAVAVTTCPQRRADLCPSTMRSLDAGGFNGPNAPWLFVDGCDDLQGWRREYGLDADRQCEPRHGVRALGVTCRYPLVRAFASWCLALAETFHRDPCADRYAVFQDDVEVPRNLRQYLETIPYKPKTYWNLHLNPTNENPKEFHGKLRRPEYLDDKGFVGFVPGNQRGMGAMGLVFDRETAMTVISSRYMADRPAHQPRADKGWELNARGFRFIDGGLIDALKPLGFTELVHHPNLVRHVGRQSVMEKRPNVVAHDPNMPRKTWGRGHEGQTFPGADFDVAGYADVRRDVGFN